MAEQAKTAGAAAEPASTGGTRPAGKLLRVHHLRPAPGARSRKIRVGRGESGRRGKTAGRGTKGSKARKTIPEHFEGGQTPVHMRVPKLKGFKNPFRIEYQVVNLDKLAALYPDGGEVTVQGLVEAGAVRKASRVKVLGTGDVPVALQVTAHAFSRSAVEKITAAGGSVTTVGEGSSTTAGAAK